MPDNRNAIYIYYSGDQFLSKPNSIILNMHSDSIFTRLRSKYQKFGGAIADLEFLFLNHNYSTFSRLGKDILRILSNGLCPPYLCFA